MGWKSFKKDSAIIPLLLSAILTVVYKLGDAFVVNHLIVSGNSFIGAVAYLVLGSSVGLVMYYFLCQSGFGRFIDERFSRIRVISKKAEKMAVVTGLTGAVCTSIYLWSFRSLDPSIVVPLSTLMIVFVAIYESFSGKVNFKIIYPSLFFVISGVAISFIHAGNFSGISVKTALVLVFAYNGIAALGELFMKRGVDHSDAVSFGFWRFYWLTVGAYLIAFGYAVIFGRLGELFDSILKGLMVVPFVGLVMLVVFFATGWANKGLALSNATTKNVFMSLPTVFTVLATAGINSIFPGVFPQAPIDFTSWLLRFFGATTIMWGVLRLSW